MINQRGIDLIQSFEKCRLKSYQGAADKPGVFTIGWGHVITGHEVPDLFRPGQMMRDVEITQAQADFLFEQDLQKFMNGLRLRTPTESLQALNDDQKASMVSLVYNIGLAAFKEQSTFYKLLVAGNLDQIPDRGFKGWIHSNGGVTNGLIVRRAAEKALFLSDYGPYDLFVQNNNSAVLGKARKYLGV